MSSQGRYGQDELSPVRAHSSKSRIITLRNVRGTFRVVDAVIVGERKNVRQEFRRERIDKGRRDDIFMGYRLECQIRDDSKRLRHLCVAGGYSRSINLDSGVPLNSICTSRKVSSECWNTIRKSSVYCIISRLEISKSPKDSSEHDCNVYVIV